MWEMFKEISNKYIKKLGLGDINDFDFIQLLDNAEGMMFSCNTTSGISICLSIFNKNNCISREGVEIQYNDITYLVKEDSPF